MAADLLRDKLWNRARTRLAAGALLVLAVGAGLAVWGIRSHWGRPGPHAAGETRPATTLEEAVAEQGKALQALDLPKYIATLDPASAPYAAEQRHWLEGLLAWRKEHPAPAVSQTVGKIEHTTDNTARVTLTRTAGSTTLTLDTVWVRGSGGRWLEHGLNRQAAESGEVTVWYPEAMDRNLALAVADRGRQALARLSDRFSWAPASPVTLEVLEDRKALAGALGPAYAARTDIALRTEYGEPVRVAVGDASDDLLLWGIAASGVLERSHNHAAPWLRDGLAQYALDRLGAASPAAALDILAAAGPVPFDRLGALPPGEAWSEAQERAAATARLLAAFLEERRGAGSATLVLDQLARQPADPRMAGPETAAERNRASLDALAAVSGEPLTALERDFTAWLQQRTAAAGERPVIPVDPSPWQAAQSRPAPAPTARTRYTLTVSLDPSNDSLTGRQSVRITNDEAGALESLYFHLFPNAPYFARNQEGPLPRPGALTVREVRIDGQPLPFTGASDETLGLRLPAPLAHGQAVTVDLVWEATVSSVEDRFGVSGSTIFLGNFYPVLAVHDEAGWHLDRYVDVGDPFYSDVADYDVTLTVPDGYQVAATGRSEEAHREQGLLRYHFAAHNVRDFAAAASPDWRMQEATVDGVRVRFYTDGESGLPPGQALSAITGAVHFYNQQWGAYPYSDLTVVNAPFGMEYPQFVMAGSPGAIAHEVAHQWWYAVVGNDEVRQMWDEGLTEFSAMYYLASAGQPKERPLPIRGSGAMDGTLYQYAARTGGQGGYGTSIYGRGWRLWEALRAEMGDAGFTRMIRAFYDRHQFAVATWADWRESVAEFGGQGAQAVFDAYVYRNEVPGSVPDRVAPARAP